MKVGFTLCALLLFSCSQDRTVLFYADEKKVEYIEDVNCNGYRINSSSYLCFTIDTPNPNTGQWIKRLNYSEQKSLAPFEIGRIDLSDGYYNDTLLFYNNDLLNKQVIIWKYEGEYWSYLNLYLLMDNKLIDIGDLSLGMDCGNCDSFNYPEERISISGNKDEIIILFVGKSIYRGSERQGTPYHSVDITTNNLRLVYNGKETSISY